MVAAATVLERILARKRLDLAAAMQAVPLEAVRARAEVAPSPRGFMAALRRGRRRALDGAVSPALIGEIKRASPSKGLIRAGFDPAGLARQYRRGGASALSVLTDEPFFGGRPEFLTQAREASGLPVLRKDFLLEPYQVYEARALGADAVLLIVAALDRRRLRELLDLARELGLDALVEVHDAAELDAALEAGAALVGVNNRDLRTFHTDLKVTDDLASRVPASCLLVSESGISSREDLLRVGAAGARAALVGESLMRQDDVAAAARRLLAFGQAPAAEALAAGPAIEPARPWVKICGHTTIESVRVAAEAGASAVGFVFAPSRRRVNPQQAADLGAAAPPWVERLGVFTPPEASGHPHDGTAATGGAWAGEIAATVRTADLTGVQLHGCRDPEAMRRLRSALPRNVRLLAGVAVRDRSDLNLLPALVQAGAEAVLLDAFVPGQAGGTGQRFDWTLAAAARERLGPAVPLYLAGGLTPENAAEAARVPGVDGLDVSSGVETGGVKDLEKIRAFLEALEGTAVRA